MCSQQVFVTLVNVLVSPLCALPKSLMYFCLDRFQLFSLFPAAPSNLDFSHKAAKLSPFQSCTLLFAFIWAVTID